MSASEKRVLVSFSDGERKSRSKVHAPLFLINFLHPLGQISSIKHFPDPRTGQPAAFLLGANYLLEVQRFRGSHSSYFIDDYVAQDGSLYLATPFDPLLLLLPILEGQKMFQDLETLLESVEHASGLAPLIQPHLGCVCDVKEAGGQHYYRLNNDRALIWLKCKLSNTMAALRSNHTSFSVMAESDLLLYSAGLLGDYLNDSWTQQLHQKLKIEAVQSNTPLEPLHQLPNEGPAEKRQRLDPKEIAKQKAATARHEAKAAKLAKEASSMRKLSSFFTPRSN